MPCTSPLTAYRSRYVNKSGKRPLVFNRMAGFADLPVTVPCGMCIGCRVDYSRTWALRCVHESKLHPFNSFVTLTYDDENLPPDTSVHKLDLQLFLKRLRKAGFRVRYFGCGEYGGDTNRPHYHLLLFGVDFHEDRRAYKQTDKGTLYTSKTLTNLWGKGHAILGNFSYQSASYVSKYIIKKRLGKDAELDPNYSRLDLSTGECFQVGREFIVMSRRPGIGSGWYDKYNKDAFPSDFLIHDDKKFIVPKYYLSKLEQQNPLLHKEIKSRRKLSLIRNGDNITPDRLEAKHVILTQREKIKSRGL